MASALGTFGSIGTDVGQFQYPHGIAVSSAGEVAVVDTCNHRVQVFSADGHFQRVFGSQGVDDVGCLNFPDGVTYDKENNIVLADSDNHRISVYSSAGEFIRKIGEHQMKNPWGVCLTHDGNIAVCSGGEKSSEVQVYSAEGALVMKFGDPSTTNRPSYVASSHEKYFVSYSDDQCVRVFDNQGRFLSKIGAAGFGNGQFNRPRGLVVDQHGQLLVCDGWNNRIQVFDLEGKFLSKFGSRGQGQGQLTFPVDLSIAPDGRLFVSELKGHRVQVFQGLEKQS